MIGVSVITHNRAKYFTQCIDALLKNNRDIDYLFIVCSDDTQYVFPKDIEVIHNDGDKWVAVNKNIALRQMIMKGCDHLFLIEDDIIVKSPDVFQRYIDAAKRAGFQHLNFALHGPANAGGYKFTDNNVDYYPHCVGAFSYYTKDCIEKAGLFDENFHNAHEHTEHTQRIGDLGMTSPFWAFADVHGSGELLGEIEGSIDNSSIRPNKDWQSNIESAIKYWRDKNPNCPI